MGGRTGPGCRPSDCITPNPTVRRRRRHAGPRHAGCRSGRANRPPGRGAALRRGARGGGAHVVLRHRGIADWVRARRGREHRRHGERGSARRQPVQTDTAGTLGVRVGLGSSVTLREDPSSLPFGYEPLTQEANGVPYANPVQLDSAAAGTAALFVNVLASDATLDQAAPAVDASQPTDLAVAGTPEQDGMRSGLP